MLEFNVKNQIISRTDSFDVVADSKGYLKVAFTFTEEWTGEIIAIFGSDNKYYNVILADNCCIVPWEVIKAPFFTVSAVCGDRITANVVRVDVERSGFAEGEAPKEPTPDVYAQVLNLAKPPHIGENGNWYTWNVKSKGFEDSGIKAEGVNGMDGKDGYTPQRGIDYWTDADKAEIKGYVDEAILGGAW